MKKQILALVSAAAIALPGLALAGSDGLGEMWNKAGLSAKARRGGKRARGRGKGGRRGKKMARMDTNGDGRISRAEFLTGARARFSKKDQNRDGVLRGAELSGKGGGRKNKRIARLFAKHDRNQDGAIDTNEAPRKLKRRFAQLDANGDGLLTREEFARPLRN